MLCAIYAVSTWNNAQMGDVMIKRLENQGLQMAKEKQTYVGKNFSATDSLAILCALQMYFRLD